MNQQAFNPQPALQGNQQLPQPQQFQPHVQREFDNGRQYFLALLENQVQEYSKFRKLNDDEMTEKIDALRFWKDMGGPQWLGEMNISQQYLKYLKRIQQIQAKRRSGIPGISFVFTRCLHSLRDSVSSSLMKLSTRAKVSTATYGSESSSSSFEHGQSHKVLDAQEINVEQEEAKPLKWE